MSEIQVTNQTEYCTCQRCRSVTAGYEDDFGYWDVCFSCGKKLEAGITTTITMMAKIMMIFGISKCTKFKRGYES